MMADTLVDRGSAPAGRTGRRCRNPLNPSTQVTADALVDAVTSAVELYIGSGARSDGGSTTTTTARGGDGGGSRAGGMGERGGSPEWHALQRRGMRCDFSWRNSAARYEALFRELHSEAGIQAGAKNAEAGKA